MASPTLFSRVGFFGSSVACLATAAVFSTHTSTVGQVPRKKTVYFVRHGQSEANLSHDDVPDARLTDLGMRQAAYWKDKSHEWKASLVLVSPLKRALETASGVFDWDKIRVEPNPPRVRVSKEARELWWHLHQCQGQTANDWLNFVGNQLPRSFTSRFENIEAVTKSGPTLYGLNLWSPLEEKALMSDPKGKLELEKRMLTALKELVRVVIDSEEDTICIVCHWGVVHAFTEVDCQNCGVVETVWEQVDTENVDRTPVHFYVPKTDDSPFDVAFDAPKTVGLEVKRLGWKIEVGNIAVPEQQPNL